MAEKTTVLDDVLKRVRSVTSLPLYHAPAAAAGEKIIYRYTPGRYDGIFEVITVTMKFISKDLATAFLAAEKVTAELCDSGERGVDRDGENALFTVREEGGTSGYIGRTGHYYVTARFEVKRRAQNIKRAVVVTDAI